MSFRALRRAKVAPASISLALTFATTAAYADETAASNANIESITVVAQRLNEARIGIETQTGASTYTIDADAIAKIPGGENTLLNQVILQAPEVAQDSFGQFHIRGEHNGLQYRLNGIILPEGISVFGQTLDAHLISSLQLVTGALPAEYGLRTAGIIDLTTKDGVFAPGGSVSMYGGSHDTLNPSFDYGGSFGRFNYFVSGDFLHNDLGIESPDGRSNPIHDTTDQYHGFGYFEDIFNDENRISVVLGLSHDRFQIPDLSGEQPSLGLTVNGPSTYPSQNLNENQREITDYGIVSLQHSDGPFDLQTSFIGRYSSLTFFPDPLGDLLYDGISQQAYKRDVAFGLQSDGAYHIGSHTVRAGFYFQEDRATSLTTSQVLPTDSDGNQTTDIPISIVDNGGKNQWIESIYLQDEWKPLPVLTINYGLRFDALQAYTSGHQFSPRVNVVWQPSDTTTLHAGYSRYFSPPPFELVGGETVSKFLNTTAAPAVTQSDTPRAEQANYFDVGAQQKLLGALTLGVDTYYKKSHNLIDEGQFGAPIILTPFNYEEGKQFGVEFTANYKSGPFSAYANFALQSAVGKNIDSAQFNFGPDDLAFISQKYIDLDHEQRATASGGISYVWNGTTVTADLLFGSGLRADLVLPDGSTVPNGEHLPYYTQINFGLAHSFQLPTIGALSARFDVVNAFDHIYAIRNGTGVGVGAPQFGPRRGFFAGLSKAL